MQEVNKALTISLFKSKWYIFLLIISIIGLIYCVYKKFKRKKNSIKF